MTPTQFREYKLRYRSAIRQILAEAEPGRLDESAFPAYSHRNPLIGWLFWQRLAVAMREIERRKPLYQVLDFGCGSGVMLPFLSANCDRVTAADIDLEPLERARRQIPLAPNVETFDLGRRELADLPPKAFDLIVALDVLEHVPDLRATLVELFQLLAPGGRLLVSGPTENLFYRIGRKLAGSEYSGAYHERGVAAIKRDAAELAAVEPIAVLYWPVPLFEIFALRP